MALETTYNGILKDLFFFFKTGTKKPLVLFNTNPGLSCELLQQCLEKGFKEHKDVKDRNCSMLRINFEPYKNGQLEPEKIKAFKDFLLEQINPFKKPKPRSMLVLENFEMMPQPYQNLSLSLINDESLDHTFLIFTTKSVNAHNFPSIIKAKSNIINAQDVEPLILKSGNVIEQNILNSMEISKPPVLHLSVKDQQRLVFHYLINHPKGICEDHPAEVSLYTEVGTTRHVHKQVFFGLSDKLNKVVSDYQNGESNVDIQQVQTAILAEQNPWKSHFNFSYMISKSHLPFFNVQEEVVYAVKQSLDKGEPISENLKEIFIYVNKQNQAEMKIACTHQGLNPDKLKELSLDLIAPVIKN